MWDCKACLKPLTVFLSAFILIAHTKAQTNEAVAWLMNEPASLWDLGVAKIISDHPRETVGGLSRSAIYVTYDFDRQVPLVTKSLDFNYEETKPRVEEICRREAAKLAGPGARLGRYFSHAGYRSSREPKDLVRIWMDTVVARIEVAAESNFPGRDDREFAEWNDKNPEADVAKAPWPFNWKPEGEETVMICEISFRTLGQIQNRDMRIGAVAVSFR